jgi:hypothetical protein
LQGDHVSRQHALLQRQEQRGGQGESGFQLVDPESSNGTYVNHRRVARPVPLKDGDIIEMGGCRIGFRFDGEAFETATGTVRSTLIDFRVVLHFGITVPGSVPTLSALNLHGPNVNFLFRTEKLADSMKQPFLLSQEAMQELGLPIRSTVVTDLAGYDDAFTFGATDLG